MLVCQFLIIGATVGLNVGNRELLMVQDDDTSGGVTLGVEKAIVVKLLEFEIE